jgi:hypothetical protein
MLYIWDKNTREMRFHFVVVGLREGGGQEATIGGFKPAEAAGN